MDRDLENDEGTLTSGMLGSSAGGVIVQSVRLGVQTGPAAGQVVRIERPLFVIGSSPEADLVLQDRSISRQHVVLAPDASGLTIRDEKSKNGTWIGEARISTAKLMGDVVLRVGDTRLEISFDRRPLRLEASDTSDFGSAIGRSPAMRHVFAVLRRAAASDITILLEGETGVGKEVLADAIHRSSPRSHGPFIAVDCGAIPPSLIESELFGHERGAFTGAVGRREGVFEAANGGTLFLDEIGELSLDLQPKLLRALERREVRPVGSAHAKAVDVRVVAATNRSLGDAVATGGFRADLYYRLAVARMRIPPLRDRAEDIPLLANAFYRRTTSEHDAELPADFVALLASHSWPGNVRELRNAVERFAMMGARTSAEVFGEGNLQRREVSLPYHEARRAALDEFERKYAEAVLERAGGVVVRAAELADMGRASFYRLLERSRVRAGVK